MALREFLLSLMNDPQRLADLKEDPEKVLGQADLTAEEKDAIRSGDNRKVQKLLGQELGAPITHVVLMVSPSPGPRPTPSPDRPPPRTTRPPPPTTRHPK